MKKISIRCFSLLFAACLILGGLSRPGYAYKLPGNQAASEGAGFADAVVLNISEYGVQFVADQLDISLSFEDYIKDQLTQPLDEIIDTLALTPGLEPLSLIVTAFDGLVDAGLDFYESIQDAKAAQMELLAADKSLFCSCMSQYNDILTKTYLLGREHRGTNEAIPERLLQMVDSVFDFSSAVKNLRADANHAIFTLAPEYSRTIRALADNLETLNANTPSAMDLYLMGRNGPDEDEPEPTPVGNYKSWKTSDPNWRDVPLNSSGSKTIGNSTGLVTALAIIAADAGVVDAGFTPKVMVTQLKQAGALNDQGLVVWDKVEKAVPGLSEGQNIPMKSSSMTQAQKLAEIEKLLRQNYKVLVQTSNDQYTVVYKVESGKAYMWDPRTDSNDLFAVYGNTPNYLTGYDYPGRQAPSSSVTGIGAQSAYYQQRPKGCIIASLAMLTSNLKQTTVTEETVFKMNGSSTNVSSWAALENKLGITTTTTVRLQAVDGSKDVPNDQKIAAVGKLLERYPAGVLLQFSENKSGVWHYPLAVGYDAVNNILYINDPADPNGKNVRFGSSWLTSEFFTSTEEALTAMRSAYGYELTAK